MTHTDILHGDHFFRINPNQQFGAWLSWHTGCASMNAFLPPDVARKLGAALIAAADAADSAHEHKEAA